MWYCITKNISCSSEECTCSILTDHISVTNAGGTYEYKWVLLERCDLIIWSKLFYCLDGVVLMSYQLGGMMCYCLMVRFFFCSTFVGCHMNYMTIKRVERSAWNCNQPSKTVLYLKDPQLESASPEAQSSFKHHTFSHQMLVIKFKLSLGSLKFFELSFLLINNFLHSVHPKHFAFFKCTLFFMLQQLICICVSPPPPHSSI